GGMRWMVVVIWIGVGVLAVTGLWLGGPGTFFQSTPLSEVLGDPRVNDALPPGAAPVGMVWIPGVFWMGSESFPDARPLHKVHVDGFWMDKTELTNAQFRRFVEETK